MDFEQVAQMDTLFKQAEPPLSVMVQPRVCGERLGCR